MLKSGGLLLALAASPCCMAQETAPMHVVRDETALARPSVAIACCRIAEGTVVTLEILEPLSSALAKRGDKFRLRLADTLSVEGNEVLASGMEGVGEIIHAEKSRSGGKPGELLLAARYLEHAGARISLRGLKLGGAGKDNVNAALATSFALGPLALFVRGREIVIPAGTRAQAKISVAADLTPQPGLATSLPTTPSTAGAAVGAPAPEATTAAPPPPSSTPAEAPPAGTTTQPAIDESTQETKE